MNTQPFYHLRPNKFIDRHLFVRLLVALHGYIDIKKYTYIGLGSYTFDDFKAIHKTTGINKMLSLEEDAEIYKRAKFNKPFKCIKIENSTCSEYISSFESSGPTIVWLDFCKPEELGQQFADLCGLLSKLHEGDIIRITLNANPSSLGFKEQQPPHIHESRLQKLKERIDEYMPATATADQLKKQNYPLLLLDCIKHACAVASSHLRIKPLFSTVYADGQQMVTFTGILMESEKQEDKKIKQQLKPLRYINFEWCKPHFINVPELTIKERLAINNKLPLTERAVGTLKKQFGFAFDNDEEIIKNYLKYYKIFPNFHHVNF